MFKLKTFLKKNKNYLILPVALIYLLITSYFYQGKILSIHFVDEEYNFTLGKQLLTGDKLYSDITTNHQPLAFILSAGIQKGTNPNSIYLLVKRHREVVILFSVVCSLLLVARFGINALIFILTFEMVKIYLFGNLFLAESLSVYPIIYLTGLAVSKINNLSKSELLAIGLCLSFIVTLLVPMWPLCLLLFLTLVFIQSKKLKAVQFILVGSLPIFLIALFFSSVQDYYADIVIFNRHFIQNNESRPLIQNVVNAFLTPFITIFDEGKQSDILPLIRVLSTAFLGLILALFFQRKFFVASLGVVLLGVSNLRYFEPGEQYYRGFHMLPWFALLIFITATLLIEILRNDKKFLKKTVAGFFIVAIIIFSISSGSNALLKEDDIQQKLYINFSNQFTMGEAVRIMADKRDESIFVSPDDWLIYWQSGLKLPREINTYYTWMEPDPFFAEKIDSTFKNERPVYFYCDCGGSKLMQKYLALYEPMIKDGNKTNLYVLPEKLQGLNQSQKSQLEFYGFNIQGENIE